MGRLTLTTTVLAAALTVAACADSKSDVTSRPVSPGGTVTTAAHGAPTEDSTPAPATVPSVASSTIAGTSAGAITTTRPAGVASTTRSSAATSVSTTALQATSVASTAPSSDVDPILQQIDSETAEIEKLLDELNQTMTT